MNYKSKKTKFIGEIQDFVKILSCNKGNRKRRFQPALKKVPASPVRMRLIDSEKHKLCYGMTVSQETFIFLNSMLIRYLIGYSYGHSMRTKFMLKLLVDEMLKRKLYPEVISTKNNKMISNTALLHDFGKLYISSSILAKPGKLTPEEYEIIKTHTTIGRDVIMSCENIFGRNDKQLRFILEVVYSHHERWDGSGYPQGLKGEEIPVSARLMAVVDAYDAITSKRIYKEAYSHEKAIEIISKGSGTYFSPQAVELFMTLKDAFSDIVLYYGDK
jgi:putative two-component system response regulator